MTKTPRWLPLCIPIYHTLQFPALCQSTARMAALCASGCLPSCRHAALVLFFMHGHLAGMRAGSARL